MTLSADRSRALRGLVVLLRRGVIATGDLEAVDVHLSRVMEADAIGFGQDASWMGWRYARDIPASWFDIHRRYEDQDPSKHLVGEVPGTFFLVNADTDRAHKASDLHRGFRGTGLGDGAMARVYNPYFDDLWFAVYREAGRARFSEDDRLILELLYPHLAGAFASKRALAVLHAPPGGSAHASPPHLYVSYPDHEVEWTSGARRFWEQRLGPVTGLGWRRIERMLLRAIRRFDSAYIGGRSQVLLPDVRIELANVTPIGKEKRRVLVLMLAESAPPGRAAAPAAALLTDRERQLAHAAVAGMTSGQMAQRFRLSALTVRSHVKTIYRKLRVSSRAELAMLLGRR